MTKKHFEAFAREILHHPTMTQDEKSAAAALVIRVAKQFNPNFDAYRFEKACGFDSFAGKAAK